MRILCTALLFVFAVQPVWAQIPSVSEAPAADRTWASAEYLLWSISRVGTPPLLTTSPQSSQGILGGPGTTTLFGGTVPFPYFSGGRFSAGYWFDDERTYGIESSFFFLGQNSAQYSANSNGNPLLARPFYNALTGANASELVANLGTGNSLVTPLAGRATITLPSQLLGADLNGVFNVYSNFSSFDSLRLDLLGGFRFLYLNEGLNVEEDLQVGSASPLFPGAALRVTDNFSTRNYFYGGQIGARVRYDFRAWELGACGKLALGVTQQQATINGSTYVNSPTMPPAQTFNGGLLALSSNIGSYSRDVFSVVPEIDFTLGYHLTDKIKVFAGYSFLYWTGVARPGDQIDFRVNTNQIPPSIPGGPHLPAFSFRGSDFWTQGISIGLELRY